MLLTEEGEMEFTINTISDSDCKKVDLEVYIEEGIENNLHIMTKKV